MVASSLVRRRRRRCGLLSSGEKVNRLRAVCPALQGNRPHRAGHMLKTGSVETGSVETGSGLSLPHPSTRGGAQRAAPTVAREPPGLRLSCPVHTYWGPSRTDGDRRPRETSAFSLDARTTPEAAKRPN